MNTTVVFEGTNKQVLNCTQLSALRQQIVTQFPALGDMLFEMIDKDSNNWTQQKYASTLQQNHEATVTIRRLVPYTFPDPQLEHLATSVFRLFNKSRICISVGFLVSPTLGLTSWEALKANDQTDLRAHFEKPEKKEVNVEVTPVAKIASDQVQALAVIRLKEPQQHRAFIKLRKNVRIAEGELTTAIFVTSTQYTQPKPILQGSETAVLGKPQDSVNRDIYEYPVKYVGASGAPVFNKNRELLGVLTSVGMATVPGIVKHVEAEMKPGDKDSEEVLRELLLTDAMEPAQPEMVTFQPRKQLAQAEEPLLDSVHEEAIEVQMPPQHVQASAPEAQPEPPRVLPPPALFGYLLDLPGRRIAELTSKGKLGRFTQHDHRFNEGISCVLIPEGLLITGPDPNGMQNAAIFTRTEMLEITSTIWPRQYHTSVYFRHQALVISGAHTPNVEKLMSDDHSWENSGALPEKRAYCASTVHSDLIYLLGGVVGKSSEPSNSILRGDALTWTRLDLQLPYVARGAGCALIGDKVLIYGGKDNDGVWEGDFQAGTFSRVTNFKMEGNMNGLQPAVFERDLVVIPSDAGTVYIYMHAGHTFTQASNLASVA
jgi:hypothetical protein